MIRTREPRSPVLRVVGFTLWADAVLALLLTMGPGSAFPRLGNPTPDEAIARARTDASAALVHVSSIPRSAIDRFEQSGAFDQSVRAGLPPGERSRTDRILQNHDVAVASAKESVTRRAVGIQMTCLMLFGVGLILTWKRTVWRCGTCGQAKQSARRVAARMPGLMGEPRTD